MQNKQSLSVAATPPAFSHNLPVIKKQVEGYLASYDFVVGEDGVKDAKAAAGELKKMADMLDTLRKEKVKEVSAPIAAFEAEVKEIHGMILSSRSAILDQVAKFEAETKEKIKGLLRAELDSLWAAFGVEGEFRKAQYTDLILLSSITNGGRPTKKATDALKERVMADKAIQDMVSMRLMTLKGRSFEAGLKVPLERHNVEHFLLDKDYDEKLNQLLVAEFKRQQETERHLAEQLAAQHQVETEHARAAHEAVVATTIAEAQRAKIPASAIEKPANVHEGDQRYTITVTMELIAKDMDVEGLKAATMRKFATAGFKSVKSVEIDKVAVGKPTNLPQREDGMKLAAGSLF